MSRTGTSPTLVMSTAAFFGHPLRAAFGHIAASGFTGVEVMVTKDPASQEPHLIREAAEEHGVAIAAIHAPFLLLTRKVWGTDPIGKIYRAAEVAEAVGAPLVVVHPPYRWQPAYRRWLRERLPEFARRTGITIAVENMFPVRLPREREMRFHAQGRIADLERFDAVVLDTSHASVAGEDIRAARERLGSRLTHVHLSDNAGKGWDSHLPVGAGVLPIAPFLEELAADGFDGTVSLELDLRDHASSVEGLRAVLAEQRALCEGLLGLRPAEGTGAGMSTEPRS